MSDALSQLKEKIAASEKAFVDRRKARMEARKKPRAPQTRSPRTESEKEAHREYMRDYMRDYSQKPEYRARKRNTERKRNSAFTVNLVDKLREFQNGACAICVVSLSPTACRPDSEHADHCHTSGRPRGLLCQICNMALGSYEKHQKPRGLLIAPYDSYLRLPPVRKLGWTFRFLKKSP